MLPCPYRVCVSSRFQAKVPTSARRALRPNSTRMDVHCLSAELARRAFSECGRRQLKPEASISTGDASVRLDSTETSTVERMWCNCHDGNKRPSQRSALVHWTLALVE